MKNKIKWLCTFVLLSFAMLFSCVLLGKLGMISAEDKETVAVAADGEEITVVIDAGHGGEDGGCVAPDGTLEKDLNLSLATDVYEILRAAGINTSLTRKDDTMLYSKYGDLDDYTGVKKTYDLKNRVRMAKESECELFVSIHMNKFSDPRYSGLQVYYSPNDSDSINAAMRIRKYAEEYLDPENEREIKKAGSNIYVLHRSQMPAVLVECGFLSNENDLELLKDRSYRKKLALCIAASVADSLANFQT